MESDSEQINFIFFGIFFDGKRSKSLPAQLKIEKRIDQVRLTLNSEFLELNLNRVDFKVLPPFGDNICVIELANGGRFETREIEKIENLRRYLKENTVFEQLMKRNKILTFLLIITATLLLLLYFVVIPRSTAILASFIPQKIIQNLSNQVKSTFSLMETSSDANLNAREVLRAKKIFSRVRDLFPNENLNFKVIKSRGFGRNAFALPDGSIYITDDFLRALINDDQILAVLLHEVGHISLKHGTRQVINAAGVGLIGAALFGVDSSLTHIPISVVIYSYSRNFENEADDFAAKNLKRINLRPKLLGDALKVLDVRDENAIQTPSFLSTHPLTEERALRLNAP